MSNTYQVATLIYDADCGVCTAAARWLSLRADDRLRLLSIQAAERDLDVGSIVAGRPLTESIHLVAGEEVSTGAQAMLRAGRLVRRWRWLARALDQPLGRFVLEPLYRQVAAHRRLVTRLLGLPETCAVPGSLPAAKGTATKVERRRT